MSDTYVLLKEEYFTKYLNSDYYVSVSGSVYSIRQHKILKPNMRNGYGWYGLHIDGGLIRKAAHRLIAECYIPNPFNLPLVRHLNDNKSDNSIGNLAWGTKSDNMNDAVKNGLLKNRPSPVGEKHRKAKLTADIVLNIRKDTEVGLSCPEISRKYKITESHASNIMCGRIWKHLIPQL